VEMYPLRFFAKAIGANDPIHHDHAAAIAAGYRSLLAPPTYVACLANMADPDPYSLLNLLNADPKYVLHGEQRLTFQQPICAGDRLYFNCHIADIYDKKNGALEFVVLDTVVTDPHHASVAEMRAVMIVRHPS
jgi:acyl dehydratase